ncbi:MAG: arsenic efflux protein [Ruminococcus sp.]|nr:arsenic efflux protein [Ruminococcus sp.]
MSEILEVLWDGLLDALKMLPFLFGVYLLIEYMEYKNSKGFEGFFKRLGFFGPVGGAALGAIPQCGISVAATNLYSGRVITLGTIIAVYIATSDEAIPIILANPEKIGALWKLIVVKVVAAIAAGIVVDLISKAVFKNKKEEKPFDELCEHCGCHDHEEEAGAHSVLLPALKHTVEIFVFVLIINIALGFVMEYLGQDFLKSILISDSVLQPFICAIVGFIPNCAASVLLTELYLQEVISFGSCIAGLCTGAGMGLLVLFKTNKHIKQNLAILGILYVVAVITGFLANLLF